MQRYRIPTLAIMLSIFLGCFSVQAQDFWEPQTNITGYVNSEVNLFDQLDGYNLNYSAAVSEAGILVTYQPASNFTIKSVFVYRPGFDFDQMLNEAFGELAVSEFLNFKVGRFLLPLSPANTFYYAPVNTSATLPLLVTNHEFYPITTDGVSLNGQVGDDVKFKYDVFAGGFKNSTWLRTGALRFFGDEVNYFKAKINSQYTVDPSYNTTYNFGFGGRLGVSYKSFIDVGFSYFQPNDEDVPLQVNLPAGAMGPGTPAMTIVQNAEFQKTTFGFNVKLQYENTKIVGELWRSNLGVYSQPLGLSNDDVALDGAFVEVSHKFGKITPYARFEDQVTDDIEYRRYTAGLNYKPSFTRTVKLEYLMYEHSSGNINGLVATLIYSF